MKYQPKFYLRDPKAAKETPVVCFFHFAGEVLKIGTEVTILPKNWNHSGQCVRRGVAYEAAINGRLRDVASKLVQAFAELRKEGRMPRAIEVRELYRQLDNPPRTVATGLFEAYERYLDESKDKLRSASITVHKTTIGHLKNFEKKRREKIDLDGFSLRDFGALQTYLIADVELNNETTWKVIKSFRAFLRYAHENEWTVNSSYLRYTQKKIPKGEKSAQVYLKEHELRTIVVMDLRDEPRLDRVRDLFVLQSHTGLRYGDVQALTAAHIDGESIHLVTTKNRKSVTVPLIDEAMAVWEKYGGRLPRMSNQKQNEYLKELMRRAGIDKEMVVVDFRGAERIERVAQKCDLIGTHTAKRTYVSILRRRGISVEAIMKITGNTRRTIEQYILTDEEDVNAEVRALWKGSRVEVTAAIQGEVSK